MLPLKKCSFFSNQIMRFVLCFFCFCFFLPCLPVPAVEKIYINDAGLKPGDGTDAVPFVRQALEKCIGKKDIVLVFKKGRYDFWPRHGLEKNYYESNTTYVNPRRCVFVLENMENIVIEGNHSEFIFHGKLQPFTIDRSAGVSIQNIVIDWDIPFGAEAEITAVAPRSFDLKIDSRLFPFMVENQKLFFVGEDWKSMWGGVKWNDPVQFDRDTLEVSQETHDDLLGEGWDEGYIAELLSGDTVRIHWNNTRRLKEGALMVLRHGVRDHSGVFMNESKNIRLENIQMRSNCGMSFLAQYCENIDYKNVQCVPNAAKRRIISGHDDGFHHSSCRGLISADRCVFKGLMDDSFNVHGACVKIIRKISPATVSCRFMHHQSFGFTWARPGERVGFIDRETMFTLGGGTVKHVVKKTAYDFDITFFEPVPAGFDVGDALENLTWTPDVRIRNSYFGSHRARGILVSTPGRVVIEKNVFNSSGSAIVIPGDANHWFESGAVKDVTIRNNLFLGSCLTSMYQFTEAVISVYPEIPVIKTEIAPYHRNIRVEDNTFDMADYPVFFVLNAEHVVFSGNTVRRTYIRPSFHARKHTLTFDACRDVNVSGNRFEGDVLGKNILLLRTPDNELRLEEGQGFRLEKR